MALNERGDFLKKPNNNFSRVGKLLNLFGYGQQSPYNANALKLALNPANKDKRLASGKSVKDWYAERVNDGNSFQEQLQNWHEMCNYSPIAAAIRIIVEECLQTEVSSPATLWAEGGDTETEKELNEFILGKLQMEDVIRAQFKQVVCFGNDFERLHLGPEGVHGWHFRRVEKIERFADEFKRLVGFGDEDEPPAETPECVLWGDEKNKKRLHKPWDFIHFRLMMDDRESEYGQSLLKPAVNTYKKLRMAEDQMIIYRMQMQPTRYLVKIDTGTASVPDMWRMVHQWINRMRTTRMLDSQRQQFEPRNDPWAIDDIIFMPTRKDSQTNIAKLDGDHEIPDICDVQYLLRQLASMLNIPPDYLGAEPEANQGLSPKSPLVMQDLRFQRSIKTVRSPVMQGYDKVCRINLALVGKDPFLPFRIKMSNIVALEAESQLELVGAQADLASRIIELGTAIQAPPEEWLRMVFTKYFPLPPELVDILAIGSILPKPQGEEGAGGLGGGMGGGMGGMGDMGGEEFGGAGPELDLGAAAGGGEAGAAGGEPLGGAGGAGGPAPAEAWDPDPLRRRKALYEWRRRAALWHNRYFSLNECVVRYQRRKGKKLQERGITEAKKEIVETRKKLFEWADKTLSKHREDLCREFGRIVRIIDGYTPDFNFVKQFRGYLSEYRGKGEAKATQFVLEGHYFPDGSNGEKHELLSVLEVNRGKRSNGSGGFLNS
jgi:hypothetical protein